MGGKTKLSLYSLDGILLDQLDFDYDFEDMVTNCIGQSYLIDDANCFLIDVSNEELVIDSKSIRNDFEKLYEKCVLFNNGEWIYEFEKSSGLERTIVSIIDGKDSVLKKIVLDELVRLKGKYQWKIDLGSEISNITTSNALANEHIRNLQEESDFLDNVLLTVHENNSFAVMNDGVLIANAVLDSLHYIGDRAIDKSILIKQNDFILNNVEKSKAYFFQKDVGNEYALNKIDEGLNFQKTLSTKGEKFFKVRIYRDKVFYLMKESSNKSVKINLYFERI